ncbi:MAG: encapsulin [Desulfurococcaceae archaeon]|nr:encapsulin [Desulfurococcaceae archaeon]
MSKHPLDLPPGRKLSREELAEALRLSIIAELDAVNLYLQLARAIDDEKYRRVFEDIAREEKTHIGEFLALLKTLDQEQVEELAKGALEVKELTGLEVREVSTAQTQQSSSAGDVFRVVSESAVKIAEASRVFRKHLPVTRVGRGVEAVSVESASGARRILPLSEISVTFRVSQRAVEYAEQFKQLPELSDAYRAALEFATLEDKFILERLLELGDAVKLEASSWDTPGTAVSDVARAIAKIVESGAREPFILFVSPSRYVKLLAVYEKTGVMELTRIKSLVREVVATPVLPDDVAVVVSANPYVVELVLGVDTQVDYLGPEDGYHKFRLWETLAVRTRLERGVAVLKQAS